MALVVEDPAYPEHWEADAVLTDGSVCHLRPITPDDQGLLQQFHSQLSAETIYYRYFAPYPQLSERDVHRFTHVDYDERVAIVATVAGELVGVGRYDKINDADAEVAFTIRDDYQGRGLGSVLLEHLAQAARERGIHRFIAETLPQNRRMVGTFTRAGYKVAQKLDEGVIKVAFEIEPNEALRSVMQAREHRAEAKSVERFLTPKTIAVVGASRRSESLGNLVLRNLLEGEFTGTLYPIHPEAARVAGLAAYRTVAEVPEPVDLAIVVVPFDKVPGVIEDTAAAGVHALIVISAGFADSGPDGVYRERRLVASIREHGMRLIGPNALGVVNTDPRYSLVAAVPNQIPPRGRVALFAQSAPLSVVALDRMALRKLGLSTFVSVGNRADVTGSEMLHYWRDDDASAVVLLYLESIANPSKFIRVARSVTRRKPVVIVRSGRTSRAFPVGARPRRTGIATNGVDQLIRNAGLIETHSLHELIDVGALLACQPLPTGRRVSVVGDSHELTLLTADACSNAGLEVVGQTVVRGTSLEDGLTTYLSDAVTGRETDAVIVVHVPPTRSYDEPVREALRDAAATATIPVIAVLHAEEGTNSLIPNIGADGAAGHGSVPFFGTVEEAVSALAAVAEYAEWRRRPSGEIPDLPDVDTDGARRIVAEVLADTHHSMHTTTVPISGPALSRLLACYGIELWPALPAATEDDAVAAADEAGWPVALKSVDPRLTRRGEFSGVRLNLENEQALRGAYLSLAAYLDPTAMSQLVVQRMAPSGVHVVLRTQEDPLFGPVVSFGLGGMVPELLADRSYQIPPLTDADAARLVRTPESASILFGYGGRTPVDIAAVEDLLVRLGRMSDELPELSRLDLNPVIAATRGIAVLGASAWLSTAQARADSEARRLTTI